jgi:hypothetical protein
MYIYIIQLDSRASFQCREVPVTMSPLINGRVSDKEIPITLYLMKDCLSD